MKYRYKKSTKSWNGRYKSPVTWNKKQGAYYGKGIIPGRIQRLARKGKQMKSWWHDRSMGFKRKRYFKRAWA